LWTEDRDSGEFHERAEKVYLVCRFHLEGEFIAQARFVTSIRE